MPTRAVLARVGAEHACLPAELALAQALRAEPRSVVVHVGLGARGSPNLCWLGDRLGAPCFAVVRAAEVVCHRGDLVDRLGAPCREFADPVRCRRCCASMLRRPHPSAFQGRSDLLAASLLACRAVFVADDADTATLVAFGVPAAAVVVTAEAAAIAARLDG
jgi:hypothetical protein